MQKKLFILASSSKNYFDIYIGKRGYDHKDIQKKARGFDIQTKDLIIKIVKKR